MSVHQKQIIYVSLGETKGREIRGERPAVVISSDAFHASGLCVVCPLTTTIRNLPGNVILQKNQIDNKLREDSEVLCGNIRTVSIERIVRPTGGAISDTQLEAIFNGIDIILGRS